MITIKCEKCGHEMQIDRSDYDALLKDVEKEEIDAQVKQFTESYKKQLDAEYGRIAAEKAQKDSETANKKDKEIAELKAKLESAQKDKEIAVSKAVAEVKQEVSKKEQEIVKLSGVLDNAEKDKELAVNKAIEDVKEKLSVKEKELIQLNSNFISIKKDAELETERIRKDYESKLEMEKQETQRWKDYRMGDSTKDLGESLEKFCEDSFNEIRMNAYPRAQFYKDNDSVKGENEETGTKGDFIFKEDTEDGIEIVSIMFEMKNQKDEKETKKTNDSHLKKLNDDRIKKGCEYAVLVSTLEPESKLYNSGIVDVSYKYPKMFVVRPQNFLAIIGLIRNMALNSLSYKRAVVSYQEEHLDVTNFENAVRAVADKINADYDKASKLYSNVEEMCDGMIKKITDFKEAFRKAQGHIGAAQNQLDNLSVKKLTKNNKTMKERFEAIEKK